VYHSLVVSGKASEQNCASAPEKLILQMSTSEPVNRKCLYVKMHFLLVYLLVRLG